jgi:hypothetical protein
MASLRYHAGRMVLSEDGDGWRVKIKTKAGKVSYSLSATELEQAVLEAEQLYADARCMNNAQPRCMNCIHWEIVKANCNVGCPEGRMTDAMDYGDGFYITQGVEPIGEPRYCSCGPDGQKQFSNDLWQADIYIQHMKHAKANH